MSESEVLEMETVVNATGLDREFEVEWCAAKVKELEKAEQQFVARWRLQRALREDTGMKATFDDLKKIRNALAYLLDRLKVLDAGQVP